MTDDGAVLLVPTGSTQLVLWRPGANTPAPIADISDVWDAEVDATGATVVYTRVVAGQEGNTYTFFAVSTATGSRVQLAQVRVPGVSGAMQAALSADGGTIVLPALAGGDTPVLQAFAVRPDGSGLRQLTSVPEGISEVTVSGDGRVAYVATFANGLLSVDLASGETHTILGRTPALRYNGFPSLTPGSFVQMAGTGFLDWGQTVSAQPPLPRSLAGIQLTLAGQPAPIAYVTPTEIGWQVPWDAQLDQVVFHQENASFEPAPIQNLCCGEPIPKFFSVGGLDTSGYPAIVAAHDGWDGLVTPERPARAGEIVHLYMTGLGAVFPSVPTGEASPADPPARITGSLTCEVNGNAAQVLFAGMAPTEVGIYQVDVRLPQDTRSGNAQIVVHLSAEFPQARGVLPVQP